MLFCLSCEWACAKFQSFDLFLQRFFSFRDRDQLAFGADDVSFKTGGAVAKTVDFGSGTGCLFSDLGAMLFGFSRDLFSFGDRFRERVDLAFGGFELLGKAGEGPEVFVDPGLFLLELLDGFVQIATRQFRSLAGLGLAALKLETSLLLSVLFLLDAVSLDLRLLLDVFKLTDLVLDP